LLSFELEEKEAKRIEAKNKSDLLTNSIEASEKELKRLEMAITLERQKLQDFNTEKELIDQFLSEIITKENVFNIIIIYSNKK